MWCSPVHFWQHSQGESLTDKYIYIWHPKIKMCVSSQKKQNWEASQSWHWMSGGANRGFKLLPPSVWRKSRRNKSQEPPLWKSQWSRVDGAAGRTGQTAVWLLCRLLHCGSMHLANRETPSLQLSGRRENRGDVMPRLKNLTVELCLARDRDGGKNCHILPLEAIDLIVFDQKEQAGTKLLQTAYGGPEWTEVSLCTDNDGKINNQPTMRKMIFRTNEIIL